MDDEAEGRSPAQDRHEHLSASIERAQEHARHLRSRITSLARDVASSEEEIARVLEDSATLRPHAADRLTRAAQEARDFAAQEREHADKSEETTP